MSDYLLNVAGGNAAKKLKDQGDGTVAELMGISDGAGGQVNMAASSVSRLASSAASTNATNVKTSAGTVDSIKAKNTAAYAVLVIVYDAVTNPPVVGTSTIKDVFEFPAGAISSYDFPAGIAMANGIGFALTKTDGTTAVASGDVTNFSLYYR